jgi:hypothetical protein
VVNDRDGVHADIDEVAELRQQVRHVAVDPGDDACALQVHLRLMKLSRGLRKRSLGAERSNAAANRLADDLGLPTGASAKRSTTGIPGLVRSSTAFI